MSTARLGFVQVIYYCVYIHAVAWFSLPFYILHLPYCILGAPSLKFSFTFCSVPIAIPSVLSFNLVAFFSCPSQNHQCIRNPQHPQSRRTWISHLAPFFEFLLCLKLCTLLWMELHPSKNRNLQNSSAGKCGKMHADLLAFQSCVGHTGNFLLFPAPSSIFAQVVFVDLRRMLYSGLFRTASWNVPLQYLLINCAWLVSVIFAQNSHKIGPRSRHHNGQPRTCSAVIYELNVLLRHSDIPLAEQLPGCSFYILHWSPKKSSGTRINHPARNNVSTSWDWFADEDVDFSFHVASRDNKWNPKWI